MAVTRGKKLKIVKQLGIFFAEIGYIPTRKESVSYTHLTLPTNIEL